MPRIQTVQRIGGVGIIVEHVETPGAIHPVELGVRGYAGIGLGDDDSRAATRTTTES
jgi:hypothetical protein